MSASKKMIVRVQGPEGTVRVECSALESAAVLRQRVAGAAGLRGPFQLSRDRACRDPLPATDTTLRALNLQHGDMLYLTPAAAAETQPSTSSPSQEQDGQQAMPPAEQLRAAQLPGSTVQPPAAEDDVDLELYQVDGSIQRQRDDKLCRHNSNGCCVHCSPLEPWDEGYLKEHNIKHISFHSYLRKITSGKFVSLEELSCKIRPGCREHPPWPRGVCSACQPPAVTLTRQPYRHVDNVLFEHPQVVERFLEYWRATGQQRVGWLYGRYERHGSVPLGVRARVAAVYEPPQRADRDGVTLAEHDPKREALDAIAARLGLRRVGWVFTDLVADDLSRGTVRHVRGVHSHFLSAQECITAGHYQNLHPNPCRHAPSGHFGSKFVTVCVTGSAEGRVTLEGYQVSGQCAALVRDGVLLPTRDAPDLAYVRESSDRQPVPDVFYSRRDRYGNEVRSAARRLPIAYVLVDVPAGVAAPPRPSLPPAASLPAALPPAHRPAAPQSPRALHAHLQAAPSLLAALSDLHVLLYLATNEALPLSPAPETLEPLLEAVARGDSDAAERAARAPQLATLLALARAAADGPAPLEPSLTWTCPLCTYHNSGAHDACEMCAMPRNSG